MNQSNKNSKKEQKGAKWGLAIFRTFINKKKFCNSTKIHEKTRILQKIKTPKNSNVLYSCLVS